jgi:cobalamin biosynthesis protein CobD/CbiB
VTPVGDVREQLATQQAGSLEAALDRVLDRLEPDDLPYIRKAVPTYVKRSSVYNGLTEALIERIARRRGEEYVPVAG